MTPEQRKAEIAALRGRIESLWDFEERGMVGPEDITGHVGLINDLDAQLAALEAEVGHEPKETDDGE